MQKLTSQEVTSALKSMVAELNSVKKEAAEYAGEVSEMKPEELVGGGGPPDFGGEGPSQFDEQGGENEEGGKGGEFGEEKGEKGEEKATKIDTPEAAKKVLDKAIKDLQDVVDNLDGICGAAESEIKEAKLERFNDKYASKLSKLTETADKGIADAKDALKHWAFLRQAHQPSKSLKDSNLKSALKTIEEVGIFQKAVQKIFGKKEVTATAVPPTGAEFSGDKFPSKTGDPKMVEERAWKGSAEKFNRDRKWEDARVNPAVDNRLTSVDYNRDDKPHVNASFVFNADSPYESYWDITDTKVGKRIVSNFLNTPDELGDKDDAAFKFFASQEYGKRIVENVMTKEQEKEAKLASKTSGSAIDGIDFVKNTLNGKYAKLTTDARAPKIKDKAAVRKYYADMYGDSEFARELTSTKKKAAEGESKDMDVEYTPEKEHPAEANPGEQFEKAKDGPGALSSLRSRSWVKGKKCPHCGKVIDSETVASIEKATWKKKVCPHCGKSVEGETESSLQNSPELIKARARRSVDVARYYAAIGAIPFEQKAIYAKAQELMGLEDSVFNTKEATLKELPIVNEAALKEAHIPESEYGIVGNTNTGVSEPKSTVATEDMNATVNSDAKFSSKKTASIVPQLTSDVGGLKLSSAFTTLESKLAKVGVSLENARIRRPIYKGQ